MDAATIQARIYAGRGKAAARIGWDCRIYRPLSAATPLGNYIGTVKAAFNSGDSTYRAPNLPGDAIWYADLDGRLTQPGDYLVRVSDSEVWFVAGQQQLVPIITVNCNRSVRISRNSMTVGAVGLQGYSSSAPCDPTTMGDLLGKGGTFPALWPASILLGGKGRDSATGLPSAARQTGWRIMLPPSTPVAIQAGDMATDDLGRRYVIDGAEETDLGWRCNAQEVHA